jgi:hypothetical protein
MCQDKRRSRTRASINVPQSPIFSTTKLTALLLGDHGNTPHVPSLLLHASHPGDIYAQRIRGQGAIILVSAGGKRCRQRPLYAGRWKLGPCRQAPGPSAWGQPRGEVPCSVAHGVTSLWGSAPVRTNWAKSRMVQAEAISALGATNTLRSFGDAATLDISRAHAYHIAAGICAWDESGATRLLVRGTAHGREASPMAAVWATGPALSAFGDVLRRRSHYRACATPVTWHTELCTAGLPPDTTALARHPSVPRGEASRHSGVSEPRAQRFLAWREDTCDDVSERAIHGARGACATVWWWGV